MAQYVDMKPRAGHRTRTRTGAITGLIDRGVDQKRLSWSSIIGLLPRCCATLSDAKVVQGDAMRWRDFRSGMCSRSGVGGGSGLPLVKNDADRLKLIRDASAR